MAAKWEPRATFLSPLHPPPSARFALRARLGVACKDKIVIVELSQLAIQPLVAIQFLGRRKDTATFGALWGQTKTFGRN